MVKCFKECFKIGNMLGGVNKSKTTKAKVITDSAPLIAAINKGYSESLSHMGRTHKIAFQWIREVAIENEVRKIKTDENPADMMTKGLLRVKLEKHSNSVLKGGLFDSITR
eukprot:Selendium_serpulae@DN2254_c0_g1_i1.p2